MVSVVPGLGGKVQGMWPQGMVTPAPSVRDGKKEIGPMSHRSCCHTLLVVADVVGAFMRIKWMGQRSNLLFYHPLLTVQGLPCPAHTRPALFHLSRVRR